MNKIKILLVSTNADNAGAPIHVRGLIKNLDNNIFECCVVFGSDGPVKHSIDQMGIKTYLICGLQSKISPQKDINSIKLLSEIVKSYKPDIIHAHSTKAGLLSRIVGYQNKIPVIYTIHGWGWRGLSFFPKIIVYLIEFFSWILFNNTYICVAMYVKNQSFITRNNSKAVVIYNSSPDLLTCKKTEGNNNEIKIVMPARLDKSKDHITVLKAVNLLPDNIKIFFCGKETNSPYLMDIAKSILGNNTNRINFLGDIDDMKQIYSTADILLLSSFFEALPLSLVEGMSLGIPIIASNVGGIPELIDDGVNGYLFEVGNVHQLSTLIKKVSDSKLRENLGRNSRKKYLQNHEEKVMISKVSNLYKSILEIVNVD